MQENSPAGQDEMDKKQQAFLLRAQKGVLKNLDENSGTLSMDKMHDHSLNTFFIQHQRFSQMMETMVDEGYIDFDWGKHEATITDAGRTFYKSE